MSDPAAAAPPPGGSESSESSARAAKRRRQEATRRRCEAKRDDLAVSVEDTSLEPTVLEAMSAEQRARLAELSGAFERDSLAAYEKKVEWSAASRTAYAARDALHAYRAEMERLARASGRAPGAEALPPQDESVLEASEPRRQRGGAASLANQYDFHGAGAAGGARAAGDGSLVAAACVVLVRTTGAVNLGQIARVCNNLDVPDLRLVDPQCDTNCSDSRKFAVHSKRLLLGARTFATLAEAVADCGVVVATSGKVAGTGGWRGVRTPEQVPELLRERRAERFAVVFGNEAEGLREAELALCHVYVTIPTRGYSSLNLGHAVAVVMYTLSRAGAEQPAGADGPEGDREALQASVSELSRLVAYYNGTMRRLGWRKDMQDSDAFGYPVERRLVNRFIGQLRAVNLKAFGDDGMDMMPREPREPRAAK